MANRSPSGAKPAGNQYGQPTSTLTIFLAMESAAAFGRQRGEERTRDRGRRKRGPHHIGADLPTGRPVQCDPRDVADDRIDRAAAARGVRERRRRQHEIGERNRVAGGRWCGGRGYAPASRRAAGRARSCGIRSRARTRRRSATVLSENPLSIQRSALLGSVTTQPLARQPSDRSARPRRPASIQDQAGDDRGEYRK